MKPVRLTAASKYHAEPVIIDGICFPSKREAARWLVLREREQRGEITDLRRQVRYPLHAAGGAVVAHYVADFEYHEDGHAITEDCKGYRTAGYKRSKRHLLAEYGIAIRET